MFSYFDLTYIPRSAPNDPKLDQDWQIPVCLDCGKFEHQFTSGKYLCHKFANKTFAGLANVVKYTNLTRLKRSKLI